MLVALLLVASAVVVGSPTPASADLGETGFITLNKTVNGLPAITDLEPGDSFTYGFVVGCDDNPCIDAFLTDTIPPELAGFTINALAVSPSSPPTSVATLTGCTVGGPVSSACALSVDFEAPLGDLNGVPVVGIPAGATYRVNLQLTVPTDLPPTWPSNGVAVPNTAEAGAENSATVTDAAAVTVSIPIEAGVATTKAWAVDSQQYDPGSAIDFTVSGTSTSNVPAESLVLQDPSDAPDGAGALGADNPFTFVDLAGLCSPSSLPEGADTVRVDLYVLDTGTWSWQEGTPGPTAVLPDLTGLEVGGVRFTYTSSTGATIVANGSAAEQCVTVAQRSTNRTTGAPLIGGATVPNDVEATLVVPGQDPVTDTATDTLEITALDISVSAGKQITPSEIAASDSFSVAVSGRNDSNGPLDSLTLSEPSDPDGAPFLTDLMVFDGFTSWTWPTGATDATFTWVFADGTTSVPISLTEASPPPVAPGGQVIAGYSITYTGSIVPGTTAGMSFDVVTDPTIVPPGDEFETFTNTVGVSGTNPAGTDTDTATDTIDVYTPTIDITLDKSIRPPLVTPGGTVLLELPAQTATNRPTVDPTEIVIEDAWDGTAATDFWDAFRARSISFTDVPSGATLSIEYATGTPPSLTWQPLVSGVTGLYSVDLATLVPDPDAIVGLRFVFEDPAGFAQGVIVKPNVEFEASATLRNGDPTTTQVGVPVAYDNEATAQGSGQAGTVPVVSPVVDADASTSIVDYGGGGSGPGTILSGKRWVGSNFSTDLTSLPSQSGSTANTRHDWGVTVPGYQSVVLSDALPGQEATPAATTFQAFDLRSIRAVSFVEDPLLRWDTVSTVELYLNGTWTTIPAPSGSWMSGTGFKGYTLSGSQSAAATGVRVTYVENTAARVASQEPGRPAPGAGVAWAATPRVFGLGWQLRNVLRVPVSTTDRWVTAAVDYNGGAGDIDNDFRVAATTGEVTYQRDSSDNILLIDNLPGVAAGKSVTPSSILAPYPGDVPPSGYPTVQVNVDTWNTSSSRASYLRVTDPVPCVSATACVTPGDDRDPDIFTGQSYDPTSNPFEQFNLTGVDFTIPGAVPVDPAATQAALWRYDPSTGTTSVETLTMAALDALAPASLTDVVGVSIVYQSTDPSTTGGLIPRGSSSSNVISMRLQTQLRPTLRSTGSDVVGGVEVDNEIVAQSFDPVLAPTATPYAAAEATVTLLAPGLDVTASKSITPTTILETDPDVPVSVTLRATDGTSTVAAETASIVDTDADFWAAFELVDLGAVTRPVGADLARVDVQVGGGSTWIEGASAATPALPAAVTDLSTVTGIRVVFFNQPTRPFSATAPPADWSAQVGLDVQLRDGVVFPGNVENTVVTEATHVNYPVVTADATASVALSTGVPRIDVAKDPQTGTGTKVVEPGLPVPWTLRFANTGTSFIGVEEVTDALGPWLRWDGTEPTYDSQGLLPTDGIVVSQAAEDQLTLTFPPGARMAPGDAFTITVRLILQPGLLPDQRATNGFTVHTDVTFAQGACTNTSGNGQGVLPGLAAGDSITIVDVLPQPGDRLLATGSARGSQWRPVFDAAFGVVPATPLPAGATYTVEVTTAASACTGAGAGSTWPTDPTCANQPGPAQWSALSAFAGEPADITALRVVVDLSGSANGRLAPGGAVRFTFRTVNVPQVNGEPTDEAVVPELWGDAATQKAWNQPGVTAALTTGGRISRAPERTGVQLLTGVFEVGKTVSGAASEFAPENVTFDASCTVPDGSGGPPVTVDLGDESPIVVPVGGSSRVVGVPLGATCEINEAGKLGDFGEAARTPAGPQTVEITAPGGEADPVPGGQSVTVDDRYDFGGLTVAKVVDEEADPPVEFGPWTFELECTAPFPTPTVVFEDTFVLDASGDPFALPADTVPVNATCTLTEVDAPDGTTIVGPGVTDNGDGSASIVVGAEAEVVVTNSYAVGTLQVTKVRTGDGVERYGAGPFVVDAECSYLDEVVYSGSVTLDEDNEYVATFAVEDGEGAAQLPAGTSCELVESTTAGATGEPVFTPSSTVIIEGGEIGGPPPAEPTAVTVTNPFDTGSIAVVKVIDGDGAELYGVGPFVVELACTYDRDGVETPISWDDSETLALELNTANGYRQEVDDLLVGAECQIVDETSTGGATDTSLGEPVIVPAPDGDTDVIEITVTNTFDTGDLVVVKERVGDGAASLGVGPFTVGVTCEWVVDGVTTPVPVPGGSSLVLAAANGYRAEVSPLPLGAACEVVETDSGGAAAVSYTPADGTVTITESPEVATVTVTNRFDLPPDPDVDDQTESAGGQSGTGSLPFTGSGRGLLALVVVGLALVAIGGALTTRRRRS